MDKIKRNERLGAMTRILTNAPNRIHTLGEFCEMFGAAKSTISEDIDLVSKAFEQFDLGVIETVAGAAGGVRYRAIPSHARAKRVLEALAGRLQEPGRMLPGGFLYTSDVTAESETAQALGEILATPYYDKAPDFVLTMETKGIPIALLTLQGMVDMMREFQAEVVGVCVMIATAMPAEKRVKGAHSLLVLDGFDSNTGNAIVRPAEAYL